MRPDFGRDLLVLLPRRDVCRGEEEVVSTDARDLHHREVAKEVAWGGHPPDARGVRPVFRDEDADPPTGPALAPLAVIARRGGVEGGEP